MALLAQHIQSLMPDHGREQANVEVNPTLFDAYKISSVPALEHKVASPTAGGQGASTRWVQVLGTTDIRGTISALDEGKPVPPGPTWPIQEPNIIASITARMKSYNWQAAIQNTKNAGWSSMADHLALPLPTTETPLSYSVDPSIIATQTITLPDGKILAHAGDRINPLTEFPFPWPQVYCVFDATSQWQVAQAEAWKIKYGTRLVLMSNRLPDDFVTWVHMTENFGSEVYSFPQSLADRLGVRAVPALIVPAGAIFDVSVIPVPPQAALAQAAGYTH
jgi:conjugal transfer pilus assembly protein TraW